MTNPQTLPVSNTVFLHSIGRALIALTISAVLLLAGFVVWHGGVDSSKLKELSFTGNALTVVFGGAKKLPAALQLNELSADGRAILSRPMQFMASDYPYFEYTITKRNPGLKIYVLWRTKESPNTLNSAPLYWRGDGPTTIELGKNKTWKGQITELAFDIYGDLREQPIEVHTLALKPRSPTVILSTIWSGWTAYRGWTQKSTNYLRGVPAEAILSPTLAAAAWAGMALLLLLARQLLKKANSAGQLLSYTAAVLIPWIALDMLWQSELSAQLTETQHQFKGKTQHDKRLSELDGSLYKYALHLKKSVLPEPGPKILLLHDSKHMTYTRLKAQYYLLPHNVYNYDRFPLLRASRSANYIWVLGEIEGLAFSAETTSLNWKTAKGKARSVQVEEIDSNPLGKLYKILRRSK